MDRGVPESTIVQGVIGPDHGPRAHHRNGHGIVPLPAHCGKEKESLRGVEVVSSFRRHPENKIKPFSEKEKPKQVVRGTQVPPVGRQRADA